MTNNESHATTAPVVTDEDIDAIAEAAEVTTQTVFRRLLKLPVRGRAEKRTDRAIDARLGEQVALSLRPTRHGI